MAWLNRTVLIVLALFVTGCGNVELPVITNGLRAEEVDRRCAATFPALRPIEVRSTPDGVSHRTYYRRELTGEVDTYILVGYQNGEVSSVEYVSKAR